MKKFTFVEFFYVNQKTKMTTMIYNKGTKEEIDFYLLFYSVVLLTK